MNELLIGNACSLCAIITDSVSGTRKKRSEILAVQIISYIFYGIGTIVLKGYSSTAQNVVSVFRNLAAIRNINSRALEWTLIALGVVLGAAFNNLGLLGWLPVIANLEYSVAVFRFRDGERPLKIAFILCVGMYFFFSMAIRNYVAAAGNVVVVVTTALSLIREKKSGQDA